VNRREIENIIALELVPWSTEKELRVFPAKIVLAMTS